MVFLYLLLTLKLFLMAIKNIRLEVMHFLEKNVDEFINQYLIPVEKIWQPTDFLPNSESDTFFEEVRYEISSGTIIFYHLVLS